MKGRYEALLRNLTNEILIIARATNVESKDFTVSYCAGTAIKEYEPKLFSDLKKWRIFFEKKEKNKVFKLYGPTLDTRFSVVFTDFRDVKYFVNKVCNLLTKRMLNDEN